jgi:hypothetical protein
MTDPNRLVDGSQSPHTRALLRAGKAETSPDGFSERLLASVAGAAAPSKVTSAAGASFGSGAKLGGAVAGAGSSSGAATSVVLGAAKWVAVGMLGGGILAASADVALSPRRETTSAFAKTDASVVRATPPKTQVPPAGPSSPAEPTAVASPRTLDLVKEKGGNVATAPSSVQASQLGHEVELIDRVRRALAAGNTSLALSELTAYERVSRTGVLDREARVLRIQALRDAGDAAGAQQLTARYLADFPDDAHALRLRAQDAQSLKRAP